MTSNTPDKSPKTPVAAPTARRTARMDQGRSRAGRAASRSGGRAAYRAGTNGSAGGISPLVGWSVAFIAVAVVVIGVALVLSSSGPGVITTPTVLTPTTIPWSGRTLGDSNAPVTLDMYGDFRCSACYAFTTGGTEAGLVSNYIATGRAKLVWHDRLVIDQGTGENASRDAANAAWCAADQNQFWVMHDWLYANDGAGSEDPSAFTAARLSAIGKAAALDMTKFQSCLDAGTHDAAITAEDAGERATVDSTPTIMVNGVATQDDTYATIKAAIDAAPTAAPTQAPTTAPTQAPTPSPAPSITPSDTPSVKPS